MALSTFSDIKAAVADWLDRSDLTTQIPDFIRLAELRIYRELRMPPMEAVVTVASSNQAVALPSNYVEMKSVTAKGTPDKGLKRVSYRDQSKTTGTGIPSTYSRRANEIIVHPAPDSSTDYELYYWADIGSIIDEADGQNWFTENAPDILLYGALLEASPYLNDDERVGIWQTAFKESIRNIQTMADKAEHSGSGIGVTTTSGVY